MITEDLMIFVNGFYLAHYKLMDVCDLEKKKIPIYVRESLKNCDAASEPSSAEVTEYNLVVKT